MNRNHGRILLAVGGCSLLLCATSAPVMAQNAKENTIVSVEILLPQIVGDPLVAQRWGRIFQELGEVSRIRQPLPGDKPEIRETQRGPLRIVNVVGELNRQGELVFPQRSFTMQQTDQIKTWLTELKLYGAQGAPDGKKFWGLNKEQFDSIVKALSSPTAASTRGKSIHDVLDSLSIDNYAVIVHPDSKAAFREIESNVFDQELEGLTGGVSLATVLRSQGYGFRPLRTPRATIELTIQPLSEISDAWPIGWDIDDSVPRTQIVPNLYEFIKTGFEKAPLLKVLDAIATQTKTPILIDTHLCTLKEIDLSTLMVSYPDKQTAWSLVLGSVVRQVRLTYKIRLDEANRPFVWVMPFVPTPVGK